MNVKKKISRWIPLTPIQGSFELALEKVLSFLDNLIIFDLFILKKFRAFRAGREDSDCQLELSQSFCYSNL